MAKTVDVARLYDQLNMARDFTRAGYQLGKTRTGPERDDGVLVILEECVAEIKVPTLEVDDGQ